MRAEDALALAKSYVKKSIAGAGAIKGDKGDPGSDGFSPIVSIDKFGSETTISITDATHQETAKVLDGVDGKDGETPVVTIGGNGNWFINGVDTLVSAKGAKGDTGSGFSVTKTYASVEEMVADAVPANESEVVVVITGDFGNFYIRLASYVDPTGETDGYLPIGSASDISAIKGEKGNDGITPRIDPASKHWFIGDDDTGILAEGADGKDGETPHIGKNKHWFIGDADTGTVAEGKDGRSINSIAKDENDDIVVTYSDGTTQNIGKLAVDVQADFLTSDGFGNLRYYNGKFQYYDAETSKWVDTSVSPDNVYIMQMIPQPMKSIMGSYDIEIGKNKLMWKEPPDTVIDGQVACVVEKVVIRRKLGSAPKSESDGDLVIEVDRADFGVYSKNYFVDEAITPSMDDVWHYKAFPISTTGFVNTDTFNETKIFCKDYYLYGFKLDQNESDPASMITYLTDCDNNGFQPAKMDYANDTFDYGGWQDAWFIKNLKPCMLNYDGTVAYELDKNDYSLKANGEASDIADYAFEGNAMVGVPKVYWKIVDNGDDTANVYFSNKKIDEDFVCWSHIDNNGKEIDYCYMPIYNGSANGGKLRSISGKTPINSSTGQTEIAYALKNNQTDAVIWYTEVYSDRMLINLLLLLIGKSVNTQETFGYGHYAGSTLLSTGTLNNKGAFYGTNGSSKAVKVFGIENWWGNQWRRIAGWVNSYGTQKIKMTYGQTDGSTVDGYSEAGNGYIELKNSIPSNANGYISKMLFNKNGLTPISGSGSSTTYYCDGLFINNSAITCACVGSDSYFGVAAGAWATALNNALGYAQWDFGASISCKPLATT